MKTQWAIGPKTGWSAGSNSESCGALYIISDRFDYGPDKDKLYWLETGMIFCCVQEGIRKHYRRKAR